MFTTQSDQNPINSASIPDLQTQLEDLLNVVWEAESSWRLDDKIDLALSRRRLDYQLEEVHE
jgi:hypothetical protein